jgi:hypothetical protein
MEIGLYSLGNMVAMGDDQVEIENGRDVAKDEVIRAVFDTPFLGVEVLCAEKAWPFFD